MKDSETLAHVRVIIISYNTAKLTVKAIDSVLESQGVIPEIVVIDNASSDRTLATLKRKYGLRMNRTYHRNWQAEVSKPEVLERFPSVQRDRAVVTEILTGSVNDISISVLLSQENLGFGRANNLGLAASPAPYAFLLNSDALVEPTTISTLVAHFTRTPVTSTSVLARTRARLDNLGFVAADLRNVDGSGQRQGGNLPNLRNVFFWITFIDDVPVLQQMLSSYQHHDNEMRSLRRRPLSKVGWVGGTAVMISTACLEEIGGFDESLFMYGEDVELCLRATKRHWDIALASDTTVVHLGSASSGSKNALLGEIKGLLILWQKHTSSQEVWALRKILKFGLRLRVLVFGILRRYGQQRVYKEALELV
jgi:GT2 family glycosyltransferase